MGERVLGMKYDIESQLQIPQLFEHKREHWRKLKHERG